MNTSAAPGVTHRERLDEMYAWCEALCTGDATYTEGDIARFWTQDARMITNGKLDFGRWEQIFYGEFDGRRKKRVLVKIIGE